MAAGYDGTIKVDTSIDTKGMNKGVKSMSNSLGGLLKSIAGVGKALLGIFVGGTLVAAVRGIISSFDLMKSSIGTSLKPLSDAFTTLRGSFVNLIATALIPLVPYIVIVVNWLTKLLQTVTMIVAALFGMRKTVGSIAKDAKKAADDTKGGLAAFDQLNVLPGKDKAAEEDTLLTPPSLEVTDEIFNTVEKVKKWFLDMWAIIAKGAVDAWIWIQKTLGPIAQWIYDHVIAPIVQWVKENPEDFKKLLIIIGLVVLGFYALVAVFYVITTIGVLVSSAFALIGVTITASVFSVGLLVIAIIALIAALIYAIYHWKELAETARNIGFLVQYYIQEYMIAPLVHGMGNALNWLKDKFISIFTDIKTFVAGIIAQIVSLSLNMVDSIISGLSKVISALTGAALGGLTISATQPAAGAPTPMQMPHLATGAVIPPNSQFAAILGDQRSGMNIEAPADLIRQIIREEMQGGQGGEMTINTPVYLDGEKIYQGMQKVQKRHGKSLLARSPI